jgi:hypothetical protein
MEPRRRSRISSLSASLSFVADVERLEVGVSGRLRRTGRATPGSARPRPVDWVDWDSLLLITDLSFASVLPLAARRTRSGTAFGNVWQRYAIITANGDDAGIRLLLGIVDNWMPVRLGRLPAFGGRVLGRRAGRLHRGSGVRVRARRGRRAVQHRGRRREVNDRVSILHSSCSLRLRRSRYSRCGRSAFQSRAVRRTPYASGQALRIRT